MFDSLPVFQLVEERPLLVHHVAKRCGLSDRMVRYLAATEQIRAFRYIDTPKIWRFWKRDVDDYVERRRRPTCDQ
jgi:Helix-turn-helix domain